MANNPTRRSLLKAATGVAAYGAGVAALSAGAAVVSSGTAKGAAGGISPELARLIADHDQKREASNRYEEEIYEPARHRVQAAREAVPHIEVKGVDNYDGGPQVWSTEQTHRVKHAKWAVRQRVEFWGPGGEAGLAAHKAQRRLVAASLWRQRAIDRINNDPAWSAIYDEGERLDNLWYDSITPVLHFPVASLADLGAKLDFAAKHQHFHRDDLQDMIRADVLRLQGRHADADRLVKREG